jgi:hypothetical protein
VYIFSVTFSKDMVVKIQFHSSNICVIPVINFTFWYMVKLKCFYVVLFSYLFLKELKLWKNFIFIFILTFFLFFLCIELYFLLLPYSLFLENNWSTAMMIISYFNINLHIHDYVFLHLINFPEKDFILSYLLLRYFI